MIGLLQGFIKGNVFRIFLDFSGPYGPIGAQMGSYGPTWACMGPAQALEEQEKFRKSADLFFLRNAFFLKIIIFPSI